MIGERAATGRAEWAANLAAMVQVSIVGFMVGGAFLGLAYWDLPYYSLAILIVTRDIVRRADRFACTRDEQSGGAATRDQCRSKEHRSFKGGPPYGITAKSSPPQRRSLATPARPLPPLATH